MGPRGRCQRGACADAPPSVPHRSLCRLVSPSHRRFPGGSGQAGAASAILVSSARAMKNFWVASSHLT
ncbi:hypothetical protein DAI22_08g206800 [Oryza sativa Japonica Group]|nr:hypothetical protein DAI22_08g206800 [Oryza sativa Japonica Group]